jgi:imidazolonepropionase
MTKQFVIGPFTQLLTMRGLPLKGPITDDQLELITDGGVLIRDGNILEVGKFNDLISKGIKQIEVESEKVALPGFIDPHTHICYAGSRANDYAMRIAGKSYLQIANEGGGIWQTVQRTREATLEDLIELTKKRAEKLLLSGITTAEVKSGYGLGYDHEIKMLKAIREVDQKYNIDLISTCLAAHILPKDFDADSKAYLEYILDGILPSIKEQNLSNRVDVFIEEGAFSEVESLEYLNRAKNMGFDLTVHGDQFHPGGSQVAIEAEVMSVDHLESSTEKEIRALAKSEVVCTVLPGASLGLGMSYAPARQLLDAGNCLAIGSDWNPGSAPMGNLITQASLLSALEKLSNAEIFAGITIRAAMALNLLDRGQLIPGQMADIACFPTDDYREILYNQGELKADFVIKKGEIANV